MWDIFPTARRYPRWLSWCRRLFEASAAAALVTAASLDDLAAGRVLRSSFPQPDDAAPTAVRTRRGDDGRVRERYEMAMAQSAQTTAGGKAEMLVLVAAVAIVAYGTGWFVGNRAG